MNKGLKEKILKLYSKGKSYNSIAKELKCSKGTISYHCRKEGLGRKYKVLTEKQVEELLNLYIYSRWTNKKLAKSFSVSLYRIKTVTTNVKRERITASMSVINWRKRTKLRLIAFFAGKCVKCGYDKCEDALEFHHKDPKEKDFNISGKSWSYDRVLEEIGRAHV